MWEQKDKTFSSFLVASLCTVDRSKVESPEREKLSLSLGSILQHISFTA
jgi:hypothetical protein